VPCAGGILHNEAESTSFDQCAAGAQVLLDAALDQRAARRFGGLEGGVTSRRIIAALAEPVCRF